MRKKIQIALVTLLSSLVMMTFACGKLGSSDPGAAAATASSAVTLSATSYTLAANGTTTITATGGSGSYVSAYASVGTLSLYSGTDVYLYTAPSTIPTSIVTITITDSSGNVGYATLSLSTGTSTVTSTSPVYTCTGGFDAQIGGVAATISLNGDTGNNVAGFIYISNYYYPVIGTCSLSGNTGTLSMTNLSLGQSFSGTVSFNSSSQIILTGSMQTSSGSVYSWSATSRGVVSTTTAPTSSCEGNYNAVIGSNTGTMTLIQNGSNQVAGYLQLQGYYYVLTGTCNGSGASVSLVNNTTNSNYVGSVSFSGSTISMNGTFTTSSGASYAWSATSH